ncbi:MAG: hypothetical protein D6719_13540, partial [Candidatus Dadabacteria bacterium]
MQCLRRFARFTWAAAVFISLLFLATTASARVHYKIADGEGGGGSGASYRERINAGGGFYNGQYGRSWYADQYYQGGLLYSDPISIAGTDDDTLYQTER